MTAQTAHIPPAHPARVIYTADDCIYNDNLCLTMGKRMIALGNSIVIGIA